MVYILDNNRNGTYGVNEYIVDEKIELRSVLLSQCAPGSIALVKTENCKYIKTTDRQWIVYTESSGSGTGSGGGSVDLTGYAREYWVNQKLSAYATKAYVEDMIEDISINPVDLTPYATKEWVENKNYLLQHQSLADYSLINETGNRINLELDNSTFQLTAKLYDKNNNLLSTSAAINLPLGELVSRIEYDNSTKSLNVITQQGTITQVSLSAIINNLATQEWVQAQGYLTQHQDISGKVDTSIYTTDMQKLKAADATLKTDLTTESNTRVAEDILIRANISAVGTSVQRIDNELNTAQTEIQALNNNKQDQLIAGDNIIIDNNIISAISTPSILQSELIAGYNIGGIVTGDTFPAGTSFETILRKLLCAAAVDVIDLYVGHFFNMTNANFSSTTVEDLLNAVDYTKAKDETPFEMTTTFGDSSTNAIWFIMVNDKYEPTAGKLISGGLTTNFTESDFKDSTCFKSIHDDVIINNANYHIYGYRTKFNANDIMSVTIE